jgi:hypothetical protein
VSGSIAGDIADRSLTNYMPHLAGSAAGSVPVGPDGQPIPGAMQEGTALSGVKYSDTNITGGHISTTATLPDGQTANVDLYNASQFEKPDTPYSTVTASDGSQWYQVASGEGMGAFYDSPHFTGDVSEADLVAESFPSVSDGTSLRTVDDGVIEASSPDGSSLWYNSAFYQEPDAPHDTIQSADGVGWYAVQPHASTPEFEGAPGGGIGDMHGADDDDEIIRDLG